MRASSGLHAKYMHVAIQIDVDAEASAIEMGDTLASKRRARENDGDGDEISGASSTPNNASHPRAIQHRTKTNHNQNLSVNPMFLQNQNQTPSLPSNIQTIQTKKTKTAVNIVIQIDPALGLHASEANSLSIGAQGSGSTRHRPKKTEKKSKKWG